jgi:hypothetical protein
MKSSGSGASKKERLKKLIAKVKKIDVSKSENPEFSAMLKEWTLRNLYQEQIRPEFFKQFRAWQKKHPNFMTPEVVDIAVVGDTAIEVSSGTGMENEPIFGVTKIQARASGSGFAPKFDFDNVQDGTNKMFYNLNEARAYARQVQQKEIDNYVRKRVIGRS